MPFLAVLQLVDRFGPRLDSALLAYLIVVALREQYTNVADGPQQAVATAASRLVKSLDAALGASMSKATPAPAAGVVGPSAKLLPGPFQLALATVGDYLSLWHAPAAATAASITISDGCASSVSDVCLAALAFHPSAAVRAAAVEFLQRRATDGPRQDDGSAHANSNMTFLPVSAGGPDSILTRSPAAPPWIDPAAVLCCRATGHPAPAPRVERD